MEKQNLSDLLKKEGTNRNNRKITCLLCGKEWRLNGYSLNHLRTEHDIWSYEINLLD